jgi:hypothetical protein
MAPNPPKKCTNKSVGELIGMYEFGILAEPELSRFSDHLLECEYCFEQAYSMQDFTSGLRRHRVTARSAEAGRPFRQPAAQKRSWLGFWPSSPMLAGGLVAACTMVLVFGLYIGVWIPLHRQTGPPAHPTDIAGINSGAWDNLAIPKAPYRGSNGRTVLRSADKAFDRAMARYQGGEFAEAIDQLEVLSELEPSEAAEAKFYLGVSLLLTGRTKDAIQPLKQAEELRVGEGREASEYYLGLAYLKSNQPQAAVGELEAVVKANGEHRQAAEHLIQSIERTK